MKVDLVTSLFDRAMIELRTSKGQRAKIKKMLCYEEFCTKLQRKPYPVRFETLGLFACQHVVQNRGSTRSLRGLISNIKTECLRRRELYLDEADRNNMAKLLGQLEFNDLSEGHRKRPLQLCHLTNIVRKLELTKTSDLYLALLLFAGHDGLLRGGELLSEISVSDVHWGGGRKSLDLRIYRTKTHRSGAAILIPYTDIGGTNFVSLLRTWFTLHHLDDRPTAAIFPAPTLDRRLDFSKTMSAQGLRLRIKQAVALIGLDPKCYSNHSLRAGGATDLFVARVSYPIIKKMGRWKSDAALLYYRDEDDVRLAVAEAFARISMGDS